MLKSAEVKKNLSDIMRLMSYSHMGYVLVALKSILCAFIICIICGRNVVSWFNDDHKIFSPESIVPSVGLV